MRPINFLGGEARDLLTQCWACGFGYTQTLELLSEHYNAHISPKQWSAWCCLLDEQVSLDHETRIANRINIDGTKTGRFTTTKLVVDLANPLDGEEF